jgi:quinol monooxygenase YgiN
MISIAAKFEAIEGNEDALSGLLTQLAKNASTEEGTLVYILNRENDNPAAFWMYELYVDVDALKLHSSGELFQRVFPQVKELLAAAPTIIRMQPLETSFPSDAPLES